MAFRVIAVSVTNQEVAVSFPESISVEKGLPLQLVEFGYRAFDALNRHIA